MEHYQHEGDGDLGLGIVRRRRRATDIQQENARLQEAMKGRLQYLEKELAKYEGQAERLNLYLTAGANHERRKGAVIQRILVARSQAVRDRLKAKLRHLEKRDVALGFIEAEVRERTKMLQEVNA